MTKKGTPAIQTTARFTQVSREQVKEKLRYLKELEAMYTLTEGNPFIIEELLKSLIEAGDIVYEHGRWKRKELRELHIPRSVQDAVQIRTAHLSEGARQVLNLAAVAGRHFDFALLQELTQQDEAQLLRLIKELMAAQPE